MIIILKIVLHVGDPIRNQVFLVLTAAFLTNLFLSSRAAVNPRIMSVFNGRTIYSGYLEISSNSSRADILTC